MKFINKEKIYVTKNSIVLKKGIYLKTTYYYYKLLDINDVNCFFEYRDSYRLEFHEGKFKTSAVQNSEFTLTTEQEYLTRIS